MGELEKDIGKFLRSISDTLRATLHVNTAQTIALEIIFLKFLNEMQQKKEKNIDGFIKGDLKLICKMNDKGIFFNELNDFINNNEIFRDLISEVFILETIDPKMIQVLQDKLDGFELQEDPAKIFRIIIDSLSTNTKNKLNTAPNVAKLISSLLRGIEPKSIYDPTIGTGYLITEVAERHKDVNIYGQDISREAVRICKMLLILEGRFKDVYNIIEGNTVVNPAHITESDNIKFDCIVSEPPFGIRDWGNNGLEDDKYNRFYMDIPLKSMGDYALITHVAEGLSDTGIAIMIEPLGVLFRMGVEGNIREALINENMIDCVITLPNNMMYGTAIPVNLLILKKNRDKNNVLFIDVSNYVESSRKLTTLRDEVIEKITTVFEKYEEEAGFSKVVSIEEIRKNDYNLMVQRYIEKKNDKEKLDLHKLTVQAKELEKKLESIHCELEKHFN